METLQPQERRSKTIFSNDNLRLNIVILAISIFIPFQTIAQGVPKAYEPVNYIGYVNGQTVRFILANGYIGASLLKLNIAAHQQPIVFEPDQGVGDEKNRLKFVTDRKGRLGYFVMDNMQDSYEENPGYFKGKYYLNHQVTLVKFRLIKRSHVNH